MKTRDQVGNLYKSHGAWYCRYYNKQLTNVAHKLGCTTEVVASRRPAHRLGSVAELSKSQALDMMREYMRSLGYLGYSGNAQMTVIDFYETVYLPDAMQRIPDSVHGVESRWRTHLAHRMGHFSVRAFTASDAQDVLDDIHKTHKNTLAHETYKRIRTAMSGIFKLAVKRRLCAFNPIRDTDVRDFGRAHGRKTEAYTMTEVFRYMRLFPDLAPVFATLAFGALRPGEVEGLQSSSYDGKFLRIAHAVSDHTGLGTTKMGEDEITPGVVPVIPLLKQFLDPIAPNRGYFFKNSRGGPIDLTNIFDREIRPKLEGAELSWKGWYGFRRGAATILHDIGIPPEIACLVLRNSEEVVKRHYIKLDREMHKRKAMARLGRAVGKQWEAFGKQSERQQSAM